MPQKIFTVIIDPDAKILFRRQYQLYPHELKAARDFISDLLKSEPISSILSLSGAPLFFIKQPGKPIKTVLDCHAFNPIAKKNKARIPRPDEMLDRLSGQYFTKMDLKTGFHQVRVRE